MSYYYLKAMGEKILFALIDQAHTAGMSIFLDSGAHTFFTVDAGDSKQKADTRDPDVYVKEYIEWLKKYGKYFECYVELDIGKITGLDKVYEWREMMWKEGLKPVLVYHPKQYKSPHKEWDNMIQAVKGKGDFLAMEGKLPLNEYFKCAKKANAHNVRVHGFAMTKDEYMKKVPFYSVDSTTWIMGAKYGHTYIFKSHSIEVHGPEDKGVRKKLKRHLIEEGIDFNKLMQDNSEEVNTMNAIAWRNFSNYLEAKSLRRWGSVGEKEKENINNSTTLSSTINPLSTIPLPDNIQIEVVPFPNTYNPYEITDKGREKEKNPKQSNTVLLTNNTSKQCIASKSTPKSTSKSTSKYITSVPDREKDSNTPEPIVKGGESEAEEGKDLTREEKYSCIDIDVSEIAPVKSTEKVSKTVKEQQNSPKTQQLVFQTSNDDKELQKQGAKKHGVSQNKKVIPNKETINQASTPIDPVRLSTDDIEEAMTEVNGKMVPIRTKTGGKNIAVIMKDNPKLWDKRKIASTLANKNSPTNFVHGRYSKRKLSAICNEDCYAYDRCVHKDFGKLCAVRQDIRSLTKNIASRNLDTVKEYLYGLYSEQIERYELNAFFEQVDGGQVDKGVSGLADKIMGWGLLLKEIEKGTGGVSVGKAEQVNVVNVGGSEDLREYAKFIMKKEREKEAEKREGSVEVEGGVKGE